MHLFASTMKKIFFFCLLFKSSLCSAQGEGNIWIFGDSTGINFNSAASAITTSAINSLEPSASISDANGNLKFYTGCISNGQLISTYLSLRNGSNQIILNGDSIYNRSSATNGHLIIPFIGDSIKDYLFTLGGLGNGYLYYSTVDMGLNGGLGQCLLRHQLLLDRTMSEKLAAVKHGNGRYWWLICHETSMINYTSTFYKLLIDSSGINFVDSQQIGTLYSPNGPNDQFRGLFGEMIFSEDGSRIAAVGYGMIDLFDFNRCTGQLSNWRSLANTNPVYPNDDFYGCSFSSDGSKLYVSSAETPGYLYQFNLLDSNITNSRQQLYLNTDSQLGIGQHQLGPDGKIYIASAYGTSSFPNNYFTNTNMYLSVISNPDSVGAACNFTPFSFYLGGRRCYYGLPNMPNYILGAIEPPCDSAVSVHDLINNKNEVHVYPNPSTGIFYFKTNGEIKTIEIMNYIGEGILLTAKREVDLSEMNAGIYFYRVKMRDGMVFSGKLVKM